MTKRSFFLVAGILLAFPCSGLTWKPMPETSPNLHTTAVKLAITLKAPVPAIVLVDQTGMDGMTTGKLEKRWRAAVPTRGQARVEVVLRPQDFRYLGTGTPNRPMPFAYLVQYDLTTDGVKDDGIAAVAVSWVNDDATVYPWERDPVPAAVTDGKIWWPGLSANNAGHFGWRYEPNGLLINNVWFNGLERDLPAGGTFRFNFRIPGALEPRLEAVAKTDAATKTGVVTNWTGLERQFDYQVDRGAYAKDQVAVDWTSFRWRRNVTTQAGARYWQELRYGIMAVGTQVETNAPALEFSFQAGTATRAPAAIAVPGRRHLTLLSAGGRIDFNALDKNWILLLSQDGTPEVPVMLVFQKRPASLTWETGALTVHWLGGAGTVAVGTPAGLAALPADTLAQWTAGRNQPALKTLEAFADRLMVMPWKCRERFAVADGWLYLRNELEFLPWRDAWGTRPQGYAPLPPLVALAVERGLLPKACAGGAADQQIPTKWGPYWAVRGNVIEYRLPVPAVWDYYALRREPPAVDAKLHAKLLRTVSREKIEKLFAYAADPAVIAPGVFPHCESHDFVAGGWRASAYMQPEDLTRFRTLVHNKARGALFPQNYQYRKDPVSGVQYVACTAWGDNYYGAWYDVNGENAGDIDYWQGLTLYGLYTQAKYGDDWDTMRRFWPTIRSLASYWEALHSWALMSPGAREAGEMYHGDMPTAGFAGLVGFHKLAQRLGTPYQQDLAACLMTKASIPMITKFGFGDYLRPFGIAASGNPLCTGFGECWVASFQSPTPTVSNMASRDPWWVTGCIGPQSAQTETMDLYMKGCRRDVDAFETTVRRLCPDREFAAHRPENVMPHLMLRTFLGDPWRQNAATFLDGYCSEYLMRDAHVVSGLLAWDCPVRLEDWYPAFVKTAAWTAADGARIVLDASAPATVRLTLHASLPSPVCQVDGVAVPVTALDAWNGWQRVELAVPKGTHEIRVVGGR